MFFFSLSRTKHKILHTFHICVNDETGVCVHLVILKKKKKKRGWHCPQEEGGNTHTCTGGLEAQVEDKNISSVD